VSTASAEANKAVEMAHTVRENGSEVPTEVVGDAGALIPGRTELGPHHPGQ
jgi:hypothetical protein